MSIQIEGAVYAGFKVTKGKVVDGIQKPSKTIHTVLHDDKIVKVAVNTGSIELAKVPTGKMVNLFIEEVSFLKQDFSEIFISGGAVQVGMIEDKKAA